MRNHNSFAYIYFKGGFLMRKQMTKFISVALATTAILSTGVAYAEAAQQTRATASGEIVSPRFLAMQDIDASFSISSGTAYCYGYTKVQSGYTAKVKVELQKNNGSWTTVKTWTKTSTGTIAKVDETYSVGSGSYRLKVTHEALQNGVSVETSTKYYY